MKNKSKKFNELKFSNNLHVSAGNHSCLFFFFF